MNMVKMEQENSINKSGKITTEHLKGVKMRVTSRKMDVRMMLAREQPRKVLNVKVVERHVKFQMEDMNIF